MSIQKITIKPVVKELIHKNDEENTHFDVLSYQGAGNQEKILGSLFIVGQVKYAEEDLSYVINLVSSLAKREYYSEQSLQTQNAKNAFERMLRKLNEVLDDFFKNKDIKLNIGLVGISGENIYISRLGKFKIALARNDKYIDVLNNVELFNKDTESAQQFSNIISGTLQPNDKLFAYFPTRPVTAREKQLNEIFLKEGQDFFADKIAHLAANAANFACCGVHIEMRQIKEIPVAPMNGYQGHVIPTKKANAEIPLVKTVSSDEVSAIQQESTETKEESVLNQDNMRIIPSELSITRRTNFFTASANQLFRLVSINRLSGKARSRRFIVIAAIIILPLLTFAILKTSGGSSQVKNAINQANENLRLAQSRLNQNDQKGARSLLQAALSNSIGLSNKKLETIRQEINKTLDTINRVSDKQPELYFSPADQNTGPGLVLIAANAELPKVADSAGSVFSISQEAKEELYQLKTEAQFIFETKSAISVFNGFDAFSVYNTDSKKSAGYSLKEPAQATDAVLYEDNLYILSANLIYKYADAATGGVKRTDWGGDAAIGEQVSIAVDGNLYTLTGNGRLIKFFKGKKDGEFDLQVTPSSDSRIFTHKDSAFIYLADKAVGRVYIFDKNDGSLKTTYNLNSTGSITDISVSPNGTIWILSSDNKVWVIR